MSNNQEKIAFSMRGDAELKHQIDTLRFLRRDIVQHLQLMRSYEYGNDDSMRQATFIVQEYNFPYDVYSLACQLEDLHSIVETVSVADIDFLLDEAKAIAQELLHPFRSSVAGQAESDSLAADFLACELLELFFGDSNKKSPDYIVKAREDAKRYVIGEIYPNITKSLWYRSGKEKYSALLAKNSKLKFQKNLAILFSLAVLFLFLISIPAFRASEQPLDSIESDQVGSRSIDKATSYVGSVNSDIIHKSSCRHAKNISDENRVYYVTVSDAEKDGRSRCSVCFDK